jgi:hypothetical protein
MGRWARCLSAFLLTHAGGAALRPIGGGTDAERAKCGVFHQGGGIREGGLLGRPRRIPGRAVSQSRLVNSWPTVESVR